MAPKTCFTTQHDRIRLLEDRIGHVGDFSPCRQRIRDHGFEHLGRDNHWLTEPNTAFHDPPLDDGQFLHRPFDSQIAAGNHDRIGAFDHIGDRSDRQLVLDFGDDQRFTPFFEKNITQFVQIAFLSYKTQRNKIDAELCAERNISKILFGERR